MYNKQSKDDKEKNLRMKQLPHSDKLIDRLALILNHNIRPSAIKMIIKFLSVHDFLIDPLFKLCKSNLEKYYGMIEMLLITLTNKKNKQLIKIFDEKYKKVISQIILKEIIAFNTSKVPSDHLRQSFGIYFQRIKSSEFNDIFLGYDGVTILQGNSNGEFTEYYRFFVFFCSFKFVFMCHFHCH